MSVPFEEWTREEKNDFASRRMDEMKLLNEKYKQRHAEVEKDRIKAEEKNSSVTSLSSPKEKSGLSEDLKAEADICSKPKVKEREWDRGKFKSDFEDWNVHKYPPRHQANWRDYSEKRSGRKENWRDRSITSGRDYHGSSSRFRESGRSWGNRKYSETSNQGASNYRNDSSFQRQRSRGYNTDRNNYRSFHNSKFDSRRKSFVGASGSASQSPSDSEIEPIKQSTGFENDRMWRDDDKNEDRHKQIRVENWVKSVNSACLDVDSSLNASKLQEVECQNESWPKFEFGNVDTKEEGLNADSNITDPEGIWANLVQEDKFRCQHPYEANNSAQSASTRFLDKKTGRKDDSDNNEYIRNRMLKPKELDTDNEQRKGESPSKNLSSINAFLLKFSGTLDNQGYKNNSAQSASTRFPDKKTGRKDDSDNNEYIRSRMLKPKELDTDNEQRKGESPSKNLSSINAFLLKFSGTLDNQGYKKQSDRRPNWKKPDNVLRKGKYVESKLKTESRPSGSCKRFEDDSHSGDKCEWSSHELESNDSVLVRIESHTVKRTIYNSFVDTERDNMQHTLLRNELLSYSGYEPELGTDLNPIQVSETIQLNSIESGIWDDCDEDDDDIKFLKFVEHKQDSDILCQESSLHSLTNVHSEIDGADYNIYQMEAEKLHPSNDNDSEYATKVIQSEMGDFEDKPCKKGFTLQYSGDNLPAENTLKFNNESSLNIESSDIHTIATKNPLVEPLGEITVSNSSKTVNILNPDDNNNDDPNNDVQCLNTINPEVFHGTAKNLEVEFLLNEGAPLGISPNSEYPITPTNDCNTKELNADTFVVSQDNEIPMEETAEHLNLEFPCPLAELSAQNMSISSNEDPNSSNSIIETSEKNVIETSVQKGHILLNELTGLSSEENSCFTIEAKNASRPSTPADKFPICQIEADNKMDDLDMMEINSSISKKEDIDKHLEVKKYTPDDSLPK